METPGGFGEWLKMRRKALDLTQEELAERARCSVFALRKIESGERKPSKQLAGLLAQALEVPEVDRPTFIRAARGEAAAMQARPQAPSRAAVTLAREPGPHCAAPAPGFGLLPAPATPLVGRQAELAALERIFGDPHCRLLTLTGMGGVGKTRLAIDFAARQRARFPGGVYFVPLASLSSPELIVPSMAEVFGLTFSGPAEPKMQLQNFLAQWTQPWLLVLDNLEHLLLPPSQAGRGLDVAALIAESLERLPNIKLLVTSRERLNLYGEWTFELHGLPLPPQDFYPEDTGQLQEYGAAALFLLSARRVQPEFEVLRDDLPALLRICRLLDGIPLALEMASAWVRTLSLQEIASEIETGLDLLTTSMRDIPERHRSIRATFDHSWKLLSAEERCSLRRLSVFQGEFSLQAAQEVTGISLPILAAMLSKSLVRRAESRRYDLHPVIRQCVLPYHCASPHCDEIHHRHAEYFLGLLRDRQQALKSSAQQAVIRELLREMDNLRAAWNWAIQRRKFGLIGQALRSLAWLCDLAGWLGEGIEQLELAVQALRSGEADAERQRILGQTLAQQGILYFRKGRFDQALARYQESLSLLRASGEASLLVDPLIFNGILLHIMGEVDNARAMLDEGLACARHAGETWFEAYGLYNQGYLAALSGEYAVGYKQMLASLAIWRRLGDPSSIALGLNFISPTAIRLGFLAEAQAFLEESQEICTQIGDRWGLGTAYRNLGLTALARGEAVQAGVLIRKSLDIFGGYTVGWDIARSQTDLGQALIMAGALPEARHTLLEALHAAVEAQVPPVALDALLGLACLHLCFGQPGPALEIALLVFDQPASVFQTRENAERIILEAEAQLSARDSRAIRENASSQSLDLTIARLLSQRSLLEQS